MPLPPPSDENPRPPPRVSDQIRRLWISATEESISGDLARARKLASEASPDEARLVRSYLQALERLERWLHDL